MKWTRTEFVTRASHGPIHRKGYTSGTFSIARDRGDWLIFHQPTGMLFLYSEWPTLAAAKKFADRLAEWPWDDDKLHRHPEAFNESCHIVAQELGFERRKMTRIG